MRIKEKIVTYLILLTLAFIVIFPLAQLFGAALSPKASGQIVLTDLRWENFATAWKESNFFHHLLISILISSCTVLLVLLLAPLAAYALEIIKIPGRKILSVVFLVGILIPLEGIVIPIYYLYKDTPLASTPLALIITHTGLSISFGVFWMQATFRTQAYEMFEAAQLDGANKIQIFTKIAMPLAKPGVFTLALLTFMWVWNDYYLAFILINDSEQRPVTVILGDFATKYTNEVNLMSAGAILVATPILILYLFFQRKFITGMISGALKG